MLGNLLSFALMSLIWGVTWAAVKLGLQELPPLFLAAMRYLSTAIVLSVALGGGAWAKMRGQSVRLVGSAILVNVGTYGLLFWGMQSVPSGLSGVVNLALVPVLLFSLAAFTGEERLTSTHAVALALGSLGLVGLFWTRLHQGGTGSGLGLAAIVAATACYCIGSVVGRPLVGVTRPLAMTMMQAAIGGPVLLLLSFITEPVSASTFSALGSPRAVGSILFLSMLGTIVGYTIYLMLLREWGMVRAGLYAFVSPIVALAVGAGLFGETVGPAEIGGAVLLMSAAALVLGKNRRAQVGADV